MNLTNIARSDVWRWALRYGAAVVAVFVGFGVRLALEEAAGGSLPTYITFYPVVMLVALLAGFGPGMVATGVTVLVVDRWILAPHGLFHFHAHLVDSIGQLLFAGMGALMSMAAELYRRSRRRAADFEQELLLRESQEKYRLLFQNMADGFALYELIDDEQGRPVDWRILEVNDAYTRHTGIPAEKIVGRCVGEMFPGVLDEYLPRFANVVATQTPADFETFSKPAGRHMHVVAFPAGGRRFASIIEDITRRKRAEDDLRESREDLNRAQAVAHTGSWRLNVQRNELVWSDENWRIFGVPRGTPLTYETFLHTVHPDDRTAVHEKWLAGLRGEPYDIEHRIVVDGRIKWVRERACLEFDGKGQVIGGFGTTQDITEKKQSEDALRASEERYRSYLEVTDQVGWTTDAGGLVVEDMPAWRRFTGQSREDIQGWGWSKALHPDDLEKTSEVWQKAVREKRNYETEYRMRRHDGVYRHLLARGVPTLNEDGSIREWVGTCIDITDRKRAEEALLDAAVQKQSAQYARTLIEVSIDPLVTISPDGKITDVNEATIKATGVSRDQLIGTDFSGYFTEPEKARDGYRHVLADGSVTDYPLTIRHRDGGLMDVLYNASVYKDARGQVLGVFAAARDITQQKRALAERERYQNRLRALAERLASTEERERRRISTQIHDTVIQTLSLSNIKLGSVRKQLADARLADRADEVNNARALIEEAIKESRSLMAELSPPLLYELGLVPALQDLTQRLEKQHQTPIHVHDDGLVKSVDKLIYGSLFEATRELILNALKHAGPCAITVSVSRDNERLRICVQDSGVGFTAPESGLFVLHKAGGFGLFSIRERLDRIGGTLDIKSQPGQGTTATILVPLNGKA